MGGGVRGSDDVNLFQSNIKDEEKRKKKKIERELNQDYYTFYILNYFAIALK